MLSRRLFYRNFSISAKAEHRLIHLVNEIQSIQRKKRNHPYNIPQDTGIQLTPTKEALFASDKAYKNRSLQSLASHLCQAYMGLPPLSPYLQGLDQETISKQTCQIGENRYEILRYLIKFCGPNESGIISLIKSFYEHSCSSSNQENVNFQFIRKFRAHVTPEYDNLFKIVISEADPGLALSFLIELREDVRVNINYLESKPATSRIEHQDHESEIIERLHFLDENLKDLLFMLFRPECLELRPISLDHTPETILKQIAMNDAVHPLETIDHLKRRLRSGRLCYALFHSSMPIKPLVIIHSALLQSIPYTVQDLDQGLSDSNIKPRVAAFYSITNACPGLSGLNLGRLLIKEVMNVLQNKYPDSLSDFVTISPIPGLHSWILENKSTILGGKASTYWNEDEIEALTNLLNFSPNRIEDKTNQQIRYIKQAYTILMRLAAKYLCSQSFSGHPLDKVARFHMRNGASMLRLNFLADSSPLGISSSFGIMVNYHYSSETIEQNQISFEKGDLVIETAIDEWLK